MDVPSYLWNQREVGEYIKYVDIVDIVPVILYLFINMMNMFPWLKVFSVFLGLKSCSAAKMSEDQLENVK